MITKSVGGVWCDYCKQHWSIRPRWAKNVDSLDPYADTKTAYHVNATTPAVWTVTSVNPKNKGRKRHYCESCVIAVTTFEATHYSPAYNWSLQDQVEAVAPVQLKIGDDLNG